MQAIVEYKPPPEGRSVNCMSCSRRFKNALNLTNHIRNNHPEFCCVTCQQIVDPGPNVSVRKIMQHSGRSGCAMTCHFGSGDSSEDGFEDSPEDSCECLFWDSQDFQRHYNSVHALCTVCHFYFQDSGCLKDHAWREHHACGTCGEKFQNLNNLNMHSISHLPRNLKCFRCPNAFPTYSAMMIHLEAGSCPGAYNGTDSFMIELFRIDAERINGLARQCKLSSQYMNDVDSKKSYKCPGCNIKKSGFKTLSALLQHVEGSACTQTYDLHMRMFRNYIQRSIEMEHAWLTDPQSMSLGEIMTGKVKLTQKEIQTINIKDVEVTLARLGLDVQSYRSAKIEDL